MKKLFLTLLLVFIFPVCVNADEIYNVNIEVDIQKDGSAKINESWEAIANQGTEWCKEIADLNDESDLSSYTVMMDGNNLIEKTWNPNETIEQKAGFYSIKYTSEGLELCFGKKDNKKHNFLLSYAISNFIFNTSDGQVLYWNLLREKNVNKVNVTIRSYDKISNSTKIYGYGYDDSISLKKGIISMVNNENSGEEYVTVLAKFPSKSFEIRNSKDEFKKFSDVLKLANSEHSVYAKGSSSSASGGDNIITIVIIIVIVLCVGFILFKFKDKIFGIFKKNNNASIGI